MSVVSLAKGRPMKVGRVSVLLRWLGPPTVVGAVPPGTVSSRKKVEVPPGTVTGVDAW